MHRLDAKGIDENAVATISEIAARAGVSVATVSRTFSHPHLVRSKTRDKVRAAIDEFGYRPNAIARNLRRQRTETVIVIVPQIQNTFFSGIIHGIEAVAHDRGYKVLLGETRGDQVRIDHYADLISTRTAEGLILLGSLLPTAVRSAMRDGAPLPIPLVLACERFEGLACPTVAIDNVAASKTAVAHLVAQGCKRIAMISGPKGNTLSEDRLAGYRAALAEAGLPRDPACEAHGDFSIETGHAAMRALLALVERPDGLFCASDEMAMGAREAIRAAGLRVPQDIAIVGFDDIRFAAFMEPPLTTMRQPAKEIGETAMQLMIDHLEGDPAACPHRVFASDLIVRQSTLR
ncbi:LacI family DNA-binding transcriptional regulator [Novosphingobium percolationis]|uniref:LacI family DNA-binding transcriptional regulator n=1 Tax=Novosphingobium percolationis TaxID=2871811 RepID=UPI001CD194DF|nr:LacI family DNA-binding transcriptional regulator [Novosphingobium percolationis]MCH7628209.1 LacI family DNA-binding transcriptional regulator [Pseudomonadota bacterium]